MSTVHEQAEERDGLDALIFQYLERVEQGASAERVLAELCERHPMDAGALRRGVSLLRDVRLHPGPAEDGLPERVGPFRLLRRLGAGGMGVVYLAEQQNPTRQVALKLVRPDQLWFEGYRERFTREIESAGRLAHPGIAPVYEMGEHDGVPWFSQEHVVGASLSELLAHVPGRSPETLTGKDLYNALSHCLELGATETTWDEHFFRGSWVDVCVRIVRQVADALQHAHERGVLHRDVKPSNILLTPAGRAVLVDFGLASLQGTERLTQTGAQLGSLHYMPPEQIDGRQTDVGPQSDVYSLGVTLYELLTLRAPYASKSLMRLRGLILDGHAPEARTVNRSVSKDVSVVVACAMDPELPRRYGSAADFGADMAAAQANRPIAARPASFLQGFTRWARRRPAAFVATLACTLLVVVTPLIFGVQSQAFAKEQQTLNTDLRAALRERDELVRATLDGFQGVIRWTAHESMQDLPGFQEERLHVIDKGLRIFERVVAVLPDSMDVRVEEALMMRTRGNILTILGRYEQARQTYDQVFPVYEEALLTPMEGDALLREYAGAKYQAALCFDRLGEKAAAAQAYREALEQQRKALVVQPDSVENLRDLAKLASALANALSDMDGGDEEAADRMEEAIEAGRRAVELVPGDPNAHQALFECLGTRGDWRSMAGLNESALEDHSEARFHLEQALDLDATRHTLRWQLIVSMRRGASIELNMGTDGAELIPEVERALSLCEKLIADYPGVASYQVERLEVMNTLALARRKGGDQAGGRELQAEAAEAYVRLARANPGQQGLALGAARLLTNLAGAIYFDEALGVERFEEVLALCERSLALAKSYERSHPGTLPARRSRMMLHYRRGCVFNQTEALDELFEEIQAMRDLNLDTPVKHFLTFALMLHLYERTLAPEDLRDAVDELELAVQRGFRDLGQWEKVGVEEKCADDARISSLAATVRLRASRD